VYIPELDNIESVNGVLLFGSVEGRYGTAYAMPAVDLESFDKEFKLSALQRIVQALPASIKLRVINSNTASNDLDFENPREESVKTTGHLEQNVILCFESALPSLLSRLTGKANSFESFVSALPWSELRLLGANPLTREEIQELLFLKTSASVIKPRSIDFSTHTLGVIRLRKQGVCDVSEHTLAEALEKVALPFTLVATMTKISTTASEYRLRSQFAQHSTSTDPLSQIQQANAAHALEKTALEGNAQVAMEWLLVLRRTSEADLRRDLQDALSALAPLGDAMVETVGCAPSFVASLPTSKQHFTFIEYETTVIAYLPVFCFGASHKQQSSPRTLVLHRQNGSLHLFDQFSEAFLAYNAIISGKSGSGKSVLANALTEALLHDPKVHMVKIDVGGSYKKECQLFGGMEIGFSLDRPSGINPFKFAANLSNVNDATDTLVKWLSTLVREESEKAVPKSLTVTLSQVIKSYIQSDSKASSLDDFFHRTPSFPRKELLTRWISGGVYENAFLASAQDTERHTSRYRYYNFESIQSAANSDYAEGVMAAVIAEINLEMFRLGSAANSDKRLVLFCDETKFFIEKNAQFFLLTTANFRKFGHGVILITQKTNNFDLDSGSGRVDSGIILNSPIRFLLEQDVERDYLRDTFGLHDQHLRAIVDQPYRGKDYREFVLQDDTGTRLVRLYLTPREYWRVTSTREDNDKLIQLQRNVPGLSLEEAIECLAIQ